MYAVDVNAELRHINEYLAPKVASQTSRCAGILCTLVQGKKTRSRELEREMEIKEKEKEEVSFLLTNMLKYRN